MCENFEIWKFVKRFSSTILLQKSRMYRKIIDGSVSVVCDNYCRIHHRCKPVYSVEPPDWFTKVLCILSVCSKFASFSQTFERKIGLS